MMVLKMYRSFSVEHQAVCRFRSLSPRFDVIIFRSSLPAFCHSFKELRSRGDERNVFCPHSVSVGNFLDGHEILRGRAEFGVTPDKMATSNGGGMEVDGAGKCFLFLLNVTPAVQ